MAEFHVIRELHLPVRKTARYCVLGELHPEVRDLWIVCHGFGQLAREFITGFECIAAGERVIVAPEALSRYYRSQSTVHGPDTPVGATWMTREDRESEIRDYVGYLDDLLGHMLPLVAADVRITAFGFSQGTATVSRWVAAGGKRIHRVILWGGLLPPEFMQPASVGALAIQPLIFVCGTSDKYFAPELVKRELQRFGELGIPATLKSFKGEHELDLATLAALAAQ